MLAVCSVNVNGIRAAHRRGGIDWLARGGGHDVVLLQEVRASTPQLQEATAGLGEFHVAHAEATAAGRSGVAILSRTPVRDVRETLAEPFAGSGRWVEATVDTELGPVRMVSVYVHTGQADSPRQDEKYAFLEAMTERLAELADAGVPALVAGDLNIAHTARDIRNAKGNVGKAGYLPAEQEYLSRWTAEGCWVDLGRAHAGDVDGPYTWWTWRGQAFDRDVGWRIDYAFATADLAQRLAAVEVGRAPSYAERWSDHAPVTVRFS